MTTISVSILSANLLNLDQEVVALNGCNDTWIHLDVMDGHFVPNLTFGAPIIEQIGKISKIPLDVHLMVSNPLFHIEQMKGMNIHNLTIHWESVIHHDNIIKIVKNYFPSVGIALVPSTPLNVIPFYLLEQIDLLLVMSVNPGFSGQSFIEGCRQKISTAAELKNKHNFKYNIQVDGGVNLQNSKELKQLGANNLVSASYIYGQGDVLQNIKSLQLIGHL